MRKIRGKLLVLGGGLLLLVSMNVIAQVTYVYTDPLGTPLAEADAQGNITATYDYTPYGNQALGTAPNGPGYIGQVNDPDTGLVYLQHRYLDPSTGRFISTDPMEPSPGNAFNFNRYDYGNNNPIANTDPDGRCPWCLIAGVAAGGALIGGGIDIAAQKHFHPGQPINKFEVGLAAAGGALAAVGGEALTGLAVDGTITTGQAVLRQAALNGTIGATQSMANDVANGKPISNQAAVNAAGANIIGSFASSGISASFSAFAGASENHALGMMAQAPVNSPSGVGGTIANTTLSAGSTTRTPSMMQAAFSQTSHVGDVIGTAGTEKLNQNNN